MGTRKAMGRVCVATALLVAMMLGGCGGDGDGDGDGDRGAAAGSDVGTIDAGVLRVGTYEGGMPYVGVKSGKVTGLDGELVTAVANRLGLDVRVERMDFAALLQAVQGGRIDIAIGDIGWNEERAKAGRFTDPPYYTPVAAAVRKGVAVRRLADVRGKTIGTLTGGFYTAGLKALTDVKVRTYQAVDAEIVDLQAGRIDLFFYDPLSLADIKRKRPDLNFDEVLVEPPSAADVRESPGLSVFQPFMSGWYLGRRAERLERVLNREIRAMYASGEAARIIEKWGGDAQKELTPLPQFAEQRRKVDRAPDWQPPRWSPAS